MQNIAICGSMTFIEQMRALCNELEAKGHRVFLPQDDEFDYQMRNAEAQIARKQKYIDDHLTKIRMSDAVLIANYDKHGVAGYIGPNTLMEMAFAYALGKEIWLLHAPGEQACQIEVLGLQPTVLEGFLQHLPNK